MGEHLKRTDTPVNKAILGTGYTTSGGISAAYSDVCYTIVCSAYSDVWSYSKLCLSRGCLLPPNKTAFCPLFDTFWRMLRHLMPSQSVPCSAVLLEVCQCPHIFFSPLHCAHSAKTSLNWVFAVDATVSILCRGQPFRIEGTLNWPRMLCKESFQQKKLRVEKQSKVEDLAEKDTMQRAAQFHLK